MGRNRNPSPIELRFLRSKIHGFPNAPLPIITPSLPVSCNIFLANNGVVTSPFPITGMRTAFFTLPISFQSASPRKPWSLVRGCIKIASIPLCSAILEISTALIFRLSHPARILTVRGVFTLFLTAINILFTFSGNRIKSAPAPALTTCFAGHPILISITSTPIPSAICAASAMTAGFEPKS